MELFLVGFLVVKLWILFKLSIKSDVVKEIMDEDGFVFLKAVRDYAELLSVKEIIEITTRDS